MPPPLISYGGILDALHLIDVSLNQDSNPIWMGFDRFYAFLLHLIHNWISFFAIPLFIYWKDQIAPYVVQLKGKRKYCT